MVSSMLLSFSEDGAAPAAGLRVLGRVDLVLVAVEEELAAAALPRVVDLRHRHHAHLLPLPRRQQQQPQPQQHQQQQQQHQQQQQQQQQQQLGPTR